VPSTVLERRLGLFNSRDFLWKTLNDDDSVDMPVPGTFDHVCRSDVRNRVAEFLIDISGLFRMGSPIFPRRSAAHPGAPPLKAHSPSSSPFDVHGRCAGRIEQRALHITAQPPPQTHEFD